MSEAEARSSLSLSRPLAFHKCTSSFSFGSTNFTPRRLFQLLDWLLKHGFYFESGSPEKRLSVTLDDGYRHLMDVLPRLVQEFGIHPVVFVPTDFIGRTNTWDYSHFLRPETHLSRTEIRELRPFGVQFGTHGHTHRDLTCLHDTEAERELRLSREIMEEILGEPIRLISYPFGRFNDTLLKLASDCGYDAGYTMNFPCPNDAPLQHGRIPIYGYDTHLSIAHKLGTGFTHRVEQVKTKVTNRLSAGTTLLNSLRHRS